MGFCKRIVVVFKNGSSSYNKRKEMKREEMKREEMKREEMKRKRGYILWRKIKSKN